MRVARLVAPVAIALVVAAGAGVSAPPAASATGCDSAAGPGVNWSDCYLPGVDLSGADLTGASLVGANLTGANLTGVDLTGATVSGVDLWDAYVACASGGVLGTGIIGVPAVLPNGWVLAAGTLTVPTVACPPEAPFIPDWVQAYGRDGSDAPCLDGWEPSWDRWPNGGTGGFVCQRSIPSLDLGPSPAAGGTAGLSVSTRVTSFDTQGTPFTAVQTSSGDLLVSVSNLPVTGSSGSGAAQQPAGIEVFRPSGDTYVSACVIRLPGTLPPTSNPAMVMGLRLFADGAFLGAAIEDNGLALYRVADLVACRSSDPTVVPQVLNAGQLPSGTLDVTFTADSRFGFVANEYGEAPGSANDGNVGVTAIDQDPAGNFTPATRLVRQISTPGNTLAGVALSPDGTRLYVSTEVAPPGTSVPGSDNPILGGPARCWQPGSGVTLYGLLSVVDVAIAESGVGNPIIQTIAAGCSPTRMVVSADGSRLFMGARGDNRLLVLSTAALEGPDPGGALLGYASTGPAGSEGSEPVGAALFSNDRLLLLANSNRFATPQQGNAEIFDVSDPASPRLVATLAAGLFPRNVTLAADGTTLFLTNFSSNEVQVIRTAVS